MSAHQSQFARAARKSNCAIHMPAVLRARLQNSAELAPARRAVARALPAHAAHLGGSVTLRSPRAGRQSTLPDMRISKS